MVVVVVAVLVAVVARRRSLAGAPGSFDCAVRDGGHWWSPGIARFGSHSVQWWSALSLHPRPRTTWARDDLALLGRDASGGGEAAALVPQAVVLHCSLRGRALDLAMSGDAATGFTSWLEAAPPGPPMRVT